MKAIGIVLGIVLLALGALFAVYKLTAGKAAKSEATPTTAATQAAATGTAAPSATPDKAAQRINASANLLTALAGAVSTGRGLA